MAHWMTPGMAKKLIDLAVKGGEQSPTQAAGGRPESGPLQGKLVCVQLCECCGGIQLFVDGVLQDTPIETPEDLVLAIQFAESEAAHAG